MSESDVTPNSNRPPPADPKRPQTTPSEVVVMVKAKARANGATTPTPVPVASAVPTMMGFSWEGAANARRARDANVQDAMTVEPEGATDADGQAAGWSGGPGGAPPRDFESEQDDPAPTRERAPRVHADASSSLALIEPQYTSPPPPAWLNICTPERVSDPSPHLVMLADPHSAAAQQFRTMRYRLEREPDAQLIAVTSPRAGEGKSIMAANLAVALSEGGRQKVLLIDAALQMPALDRLFGVAGEVGLTSVLASLTREARATVDVLSVTRSLLLLPAGPAVRSAHAALASEAAAQLIGALRRTFRYIIVDSSAVLGSGETLAWHGMIDRYVMVARRAKTTTEDLGKAADRLGRDKILGVSFMGASEKHLGT